LDGFLRDFVYDPYLFSRDEVDEKALAGLRGVVKISHTTVNGFSLANLMASRQRANGGALHSAAPRSGSEVA
jgi:hypothetical protein